MSDRPDDNQHDIEPRPDPDPTGDSAVPQPNEPVADAEGLRELTRDWPGGINDPARYETPTPDPLLDAPDDDDAIEPRGEMGFFDHLEELRSRLIKAGIGLVLAAIVCAIFADEIITGILLRPSREAGLKELLNVQPMGQLTLTLQVALVSGLIVAIPWILWQFWEFVRPGLFPKERRYASLVGVMTIICFLGGVAFAYFVMLPASLGFAAGFQYKGIETRIAVNEYYSFVLGFILACGVIFEMPMLSFALSRFGILTPEFMRKYRRHAGVVILIVAAIITPTPDPFNQLVLAVPLYLLYEISIFVAVLATRRREEAYAEMFSDAPPES